MKCPYILVLALACLFLLFGCSQTSVTDSIIESTTNSVNAIEQSLPDECKTVSVKTQLITLKSQIRSIQESCTTEKANLKAEINRWMFAFYGLLGLAIAYIIRKVLK